MPNLLKRILLVSFSLSIILLFAVFLGLLAGSTKIDPTDVIRILFNRGNSTPDSIIWLIRFPRVILAAIVGATLSLGGLVFQAILRNPLAEPYILGISGGSAIGAIIGILMGFTRFPGVFFCAFAGSMTTLVFVLFMGSGGAYLKKDSLLLSGVILNAFCSAIITFLISMSHDHKIHNILFWLMGDLSLADMRQAGILLLLVFPCFVMIFRFSNSMNLLVMGKELARTMGVNTTLITLSLLVTTSLMVSATVSYCGLLGFVGLVMPHLLRMILGPDHRVLVPACIIGGGAYMIICDLLARTIPEQGEMPTGVITAMIGAPLFIFLLKRSRK